MLYIITTKWNFQVLVCLKLEGIELNMAGVMTPLCIILLSFLCDTTYVLYSAWLQINYEYNMNKEYENFKCTNLFS